MPKLTEATPKYRLHRASGQAIVTLDGKDFYLGPHGSKASKLEYDRRIGEWLAAGRSLPNAKNAAGKYTLTVIEVLARFMKHARTYYRKNGEVTDEVENLKYAARPLKRLYGRTIAAEFGPLALKAVREGFIAEGLSRRHINDRVSRIRRIFKWAASEQLVPIETYWGLRSVDGLQEGRSDAIEKPEVGPAEDAIVNGALLKMPRTIADMVKLQRLTGARPGEIRQLRPREVDRRISPWVVTPTTHKMQHHRRKRVIFIGPQAQEILSRYLLRDPDAYCFSPAECVAEHNAARRAQRKTKVQPSQLSRANPKNPRQYAEFYSNDAYAEAVRRACKRAFPVPAGISGAERKEWIKTHVFAPNQLRHNAATDVREEFGLESASAVLGHAKLSTTEIYAERQRKKAAKVMSKIG